MFVAELDRPWLGTPFMIEGVLLDHEAKIVELQKHCRFVRIDLDRSSDAVQATFRALAEGGKGKRGGLFSRLFGRISDAMGRGGRARPVAEERDAQPTPEVTATRLKLPEGLKLQRYAEPIPIQQAIPRAERAVGSGAEAIDALMSELRENVAPDFRRIDASASALVESMIENPDAMMLVSRMRERHQGTYERSLKMSLNLLALGRHLGFPREELAHLATIGMLADIGKTRLPEALLDKPGTLTSAEMKVVKSHVDLGLSVLRKDVTLHPAVEQGVAQHHERMDGSGYPKGLKGEEISIYGRMAAVADCFAAMISDRPYAAALAPLDAIMELYKLSGAKLHEPLVEQLVQAIGAFPVGTMVELSSGEVAVVLTRNKARRMEPRVLVLAGPDRQPLATPFERDLATTDPDAEDRPPWIWRGLADGAYGIELHRYYAGGDEGSSADD